MNLDELARQLHQAAAVGGAEAGHAAVTAGAEEAEMGLRVPGGRGVTVSTAGLSARIGVNQKRGVYQEASPATAATVDTGAIAGTMADIAASAGASAVTG